MLLISGPLAVGKSSVARVLIADHGFSTIRSGPYLRDLAIKQSKGQSRADLQAMGDSLDDETDYSWLISDVVVPTLSASPTQDRWLLDCVRKQQQIAHFRSRYGAGVLHVHFTAPEEVLSARYEARMAAGQEYAGATEYSLAAAHPNELSARKLIEVADLVIDLYGTSAEDAVNAILSALMER